MQSYMDPRMMSGRPAMDMPPIHPGEFKSPLLHGSLVVMQVQSFSFFTSIFSLNSSKNFKGLLDF